MIDLKKRYYRFTPSFWNRFSKNTHYYKGMPELEESKFSAYLGFLKNIDLNNTLVLKTDLYVEAKNKRDNFFPHLKINQCIGIDISLEIIKMAKMNLIQWLPNMQFVVADVRHLPFKEHSFSAVISDSTLDQIPKNEVRHSLLEIKRIIKNKGQLILSLNNIFNFPFSLDRVIKNLFFNDFYFSFSFSPQYILSLLKRLNFQIINWDYIIPLDYSHTLLLILSKKINMIRPLTNTWLSILTKISNLTFLKQFFCVQFIILAKDNKNEE